MENSIEAWTISFKEHLLLSFKKNIYEILDEYSNVSKPLLQIGLMDFSNTLKKTDLDTKAIALEKQLGQNMSMLDEGKLLSNNFNESSRLAPLSGYENKSQISLGADNESINNLTKNVQLLMSE